ncbi:MAG: hypothetical protein QW769_10735 [Nitrososphaerales archaeon]
MPIRSYLSTDWLEDHNQDKHYLAKVFLTSDDECYILVVRNGLKFFKVDARLLRLGEMGLFERAMEDAEELLIEKGFAMKLLNQSELDEVILKKYFYFN